MYVCVYVHVHACVRPLPSMQKSLKPANRPNAAHMTLTTLANWPVLLSTTPSRTFCFLGCRQMRREPSTTAAVEGDCQGLQAKPFLAKTTKPHGARCNGYHTCASPPPYLLGAARSSLGNDFQRRGRGDVVGAHGRQRQDLR